MLNAMKVITKFRAMLQPLVILVCTQLPTLAHPGHYHPPGEDDEFDALRSDWLHLHGWFEAALALVALAAVLVFRMSTRPAVRVGAALAIGGSVALFAMR